MQGALELTFGLGLGNLGQRKKARGLSRGAAIYTDLSLRLSMQFPAIEAMLSYLRTQLLVLVPLCDERTSPTDEMKLRVI